MALLFFIGGIITHLLTWIEIFSVTKLEGIIGILGKTRLSQARSWGISKGGSYPFV